MEVALVAAVATFWSKAGEVGGTAGCGGLKVSKVGAFRGRGMSSGEGEGAVEGVRTTDPALQSTCPAYSGLRAT
jgi:hypothetical protein